MWFSPLVFTKLLRNPAYSWYVGCLSLLSSCLASIFSSFLLLMLFLFASWPSMHICHFICCICFRCVSICSASLYAYLMTCPQPPFWFILSSSAEVWMRRLVLAFCLLSVRQGQLQMVISAAVHTLFSFGCIFVPWPKSCFLAFHKHSFAHCGIEALPKLTFPPVDCHLGAQAKCLGTHFFISVQKL